MPGGPENNRTNCVLGQDDRLKHYLRPRNDQLRGLKWEAAKRPRRHLISRLNFHRYRSPRLSESAAFGGSE